MMKDYRIIACDTISVYGIYTGLTDSQNDDYQVIRNHWKRFNYELRRHGIESGTDWKKYGITYRIENELKYFTGIPHESAVSGFDSIQIPGGHYACFQHKGSMMLIRDTVYDIYREKISGSGFKINPDRELLHFEYYDNRFNWSRPDSIVDIYVPVFSDIRN